MQLDPAWRGGLLLGFVAGGVDEMVEWHVCPLHVLVGYALPGARPLSAFAVGTRKLNELLGNLRCKSSKVILQLRCQYFEFTLSWLIVAVVDGLHLQNEVASRLYCRPQPIRLPIELIAVAKRARLVDVIVRHVLVRVTRQSVGFFGVRLVVAGHVLRFNHREILQLLSVELVGIDELGRRLRLRRRFCLIAGRGDPLLSKWTWLLILLEFDVLAFPSASVLIIARYHRLARLVLRHLRSGDRLDVERRLRQLDLPFVIFGIAIRRLYALD